VPEAVTLPQLNVVIAAVEFISSQEIQLPNAHFSIPPNTSTTP